MSKLAKLCAGIIEWSAISALVAVPWIFLIQANNSFTYPKALLFRSIVIVMLIAWIVEIIETKNTKFYRVKFYIPLLIVLGIFAITTIFSIDPSLSFWGYGARADGFFTFLHMVIFFFAIATHFQDSARLAKAIEWTIKASVVPMIYGLMQHYGMDLLSGQWSSDVSARISSTLGNPLHVGNYILMIMPLTLAWVLHVKKLSSKLYFTFLLVFQFITMLFTFSRSSWLALLVCLAAFVFLIGIKNRNKPIWIGTLGAAAGAIIFTLILIQPNSALQPLQNNPYIQRFVSSFTMQDTSSLARLQVWGLAVEAIKHKPILGYGAGTFMHAYNMFYPPQLIEFDRQNYFSPHNHFLYWAYAHGLIGLIAYLMLIIYFFASAIKLLVKTADPLKKWLIIAAICGVLGFYAQMLLSILYPTTMMLLFFFMGIVAIFWRQQTEAANQTAPVKINHHQTSDQFSRLPAYWYLGLPLAGLLIIMTTNILPFCADILVKEALAKSDPAAAQARFEQAFKLQLGQGTFENRYTYAKRLLSYAGKQGMASDSAIELINQAIYQCELINKKHPLFVDSYLLAGQAAFFISSIKDDPSYAEKGRAFYEQGIKLAPTKQLARWHWGETYSAMKDTENALLKFNEAIEIAPEVPALYPELAKQYKARRMFDQANQAMDKYNQIMAARNPEH